MFNYSDQPSASSAEFKTFGIGVQTLSSLEFRSFSAGVETLSSQFNFKPSCLHLRALAVFSHSSAKGFELQGPGLKFWVDEAQIQVRFGHRIPVDCFRLQVESGSAGLSKQTLFP